MGQSATSVGAEFSDFGLSKPQTEREVELESIGFKEFGHVLESNVADQDEIIAQFRRQEIINSKLDDHLINCENEVNRLRDRNQELIKELLAKDEIIASSARRETVNSGFAQLQSDLEAEINCLRDRNEGLEEELANRDKRIADLTEQNKTIIERFEEIESQLMSKNIGTDEKVAQLTDVMRLAERFEVENAALKEHVEKLKNLISDRNEQISQCLLERDHATGAAAASRANNKMLQEKLENLQAEYTLLNANLDKGEEKCRQYEDTVRSLGCTLRCAEDKLRTIVDKLKDEMEKTRALEFKLRDASYNLCNDEGEAKELEQKAIVEQETHVPLTAKVYELNPALAS